MRKSNIVNLIAILLLCPLLYIGCTLTLFELPLDGTKEPHDTEKLKAYKQLQSKRKPEIEEVEEKKRFVRRDLQDSIDDEWIEGWEYIENMTNINSFANDEKGLDDLLVEKGKLVDFHTERPVLPSPDVRLSFIHLSDVQLHDERVYMFNKELTEFFDKVVESFEHKPDMSFYDHSYYLTLIGTIRLLCDRLPEEQKPSFMIHTGDALDMGVVSELYEFIYVTNKLRIPWFNVLGNHDYPVYGNINSQQVGVIRPNMGFQTVNSRYNFINMHGKGFDVDPLVYFSPDNAPDDDTLMTGSVYNGFDRQGKSFAEDGPLKERRNKACKDCPGYYYFEALQPKEGEPGILCIVLDTTTKDFRFSEGTIYRHKEVEGPPDKEKEFEQLNWLKNTLKSYSQDEKNWMVLVFGHHPLGKEGFFDDSYKVLKRIFYEPKYNVIAYFCGHTHEHEVRYHKNMNILDKLFSFFHRNPQNSGFWEIVTDSIIEYPKRGSLVTIRHDAEEGKWEIVLQSFWPYFLEKLDTNNAPELLKNAKKCWKASMDDGKRKKFKRFNKLDQKHHDVVLKFDYPKSE